MEKIVLQKKFRPEIEGLRFIAALLVAIYHIWFQKVSGGVDVFFVISGFLITISLINQMNRTGKIRFTVFFGNLFKRLIPIASLGLLFTTVLIFYFYPDIYKELFYKEIIASLFYYENWQLAYNSVDYLNQSDVKSPVQHYWAMSIQGQFYVIWFFMFYFLNKFIFTENQKRNKIILWFVLSFLFLSSLIFSIYLTNSNQPWAYFDVRTRVWEFAFGGLLAITINHIHLPTIITTFLSWIGLFSILFLGYFFDVSKLFPGWIALIPVMSAMFIVLSGHHESKYGANQILKHPLLMKLGGFSFSIYLWHWILLSNYKLLIDNKVGVIDGSMILIISIIIAYILTEFVEKPLRNKNVYRMKRVIYFPIIILMIISIICYGGIKLKATDLENISGLPKDNLGASIIQTGVLNKKDVKLFPSTKFVKNDLADSYQDKCNGTSQETKNRVCIYGEKKHYKKTIVLVGGSHAAHWLSALQTFASEERIRIINITKSGCRFTTYMKGNPSCNQWNQTIIKTIASYKPDLVFANADVSHALYQNVPNGFVEQFNALKNKGIKVFAVRDNPRFNINVPECLANHNNDIEQCKIKRNTMMTEPSPWMKLKEKPNNVIYKDYSKYFCDDVYCYPAIGNVIVYIDREHISKTYAKTLGPYIRKDILNALNKDDV